MPYIDKLIVYPIKSLDGVEVDTAEITEGGALHWDRAIALYNEAGRTVNAKKYPAILRVRANFDLENQKVRLQNSPSNSETFSLTNELEKLAAYFSDYFGEKLSIRQNMQSGFPDDDENSGPTLVSQASYLELQRWFPTLSLDSFRKRFRANIELGGCELAFWEDRLFAAPAQEVGFQLGEVAFLGKKPCARCTVPARDPYTAENDKSFMTSFIQMREQTMPTFANIEQFSHYYHLCVNTVLPPTERGKTLQVGDLFKQP